MWKLSPVCPQPCREDQFDIRNANYELYGRSVLVVGNLISVNPILVPKCGIPARIIFRAYYVIFLI